MTAARKNLLVDLGTTFNFTFEYRFDGEPVNLEGTNVVFTVTKPGDATTVLYTQTVAGTDGPVTITVSDEDTGAWSFKKGAYTIDLQASDGTLTGLLWGSLTVRDRSDV